MTRKKHVIVGAGVAALSAMRKIREITEYDDIKLVTMERTLPYSPAALPYLVSGSLEVREMSVIPQNYLGTTKTLLVKGKAARKVKPEQKEVVYDDGSREYYDTLLIATGSEPLIPSIRGLDTIDFLTFHNLRDYKKLAKKLKAGTKITIYGGGLVAVELASALLERGYETRLIVRSRILRGYFEEDLGHLVADILRAHQATIYQGSEIGEVRNRKGFVEISLADGTLLDSDILIICIGIRPRISIARKSKIKTRAGILVDRHMRTNIQDIYAAGDVAEAPNFFTGEPGISAILASAVAQGKVAGSNMAGEEITYKGWISMNILNLFGHMAISLGKPASPGDAYKILKEKNYGEKSHKEMIFLKDQLVGARFLNIEVDPGVIRYIIENQLEIQSDKEALFDQPQDVGRWIMLENERQKGLSLKA